MEILIVYGGLIFGFIALTILGSVVSLEFDQFIDRLTLWIVKKAARRLPNHLKDDFIEQVAADLECISGPVSKLLNAIGAFKAAHNISNTVCETQGGRQATRLRLLADGGPRGRVYMLSNKRVVIIGKTIDSIPGTPDGQVTVAIGREVFEQALRDQNNNL